MRKLPLCIKSNYGQKQLELNSLTRHFHSIIFDSLSISDNKLVGILNKIGSRVRHIELDEVVIEHESFNNILGCFKMLEKIIFIKTSIDKKVKKITGSSLVALKTLVIIRSHLRLFDYFSTSNTQVKELKISLATYTELDSETFEKFLSKQTTLDTLALRSHQGEVYKSLAKFNEKEFKLKNLHVDFKYWGCDSTVDDAFVTFLTSHQETLENLETCKTLSEKCLEFIMRNLKIKRLIIDASNLPKRPLVYDAIRPNKHLETLIITGQLNHFEVVRGLLHIYRSVQKLIISNWNSELINDSLIFIGNNLLNLNYLEIPTLTSDTPELSIPSLKTFHTDFVEEVGEWQTFCVNNPTIETLSVKWLTNRDTFTYAVIDAITSSLRNLKHIKFGAYFNPTMRIIQLMSRNCQNLRTLEVFAENANELENNSGMNNGKVKVIYYPPEAVISVFKVEPTLWTDEYDYGLDSDSGSDLSEDLSVDDMSVDYENDSDGWDDNGEDLNGFLFMIP